MKVVFCTLLFTFLVLFNSINEISSQGNSGSGVRKVNIFNNYVRDLPDIPAGQYYVLPNGNAYQSHGTGRIVVIFHKKEDFATVYQAGVNPITLGPGPFGKRPYTDKYPVVQMIPVPQETSLHSPSHN